MPLAGKSWFTAAELAELALPGLPRTKRKINERAADERWALKHDANQALARPRQGRGGGTEYHLSLLPASARVELAKRGLGGAEVALAPPPPAPASLWRWFDAQSDAVKSEARRREAILDAVARAEMAGLTRTAAIATIAAERAIASSTVWGWRRAVEGIAEADWLPHLAPRRKGGGAEAETDDALWQALRSDWLRPEKPTWESCYQRALALAASRGLALPCSRTLWRKLEREVPAAVIVLRRQGADALRQTLPPQQRTVAQLHAMELVNIDGHKWDVFVRFPNGTIQRPMMVAIQDVYSRKFLAWRVGETESAVLTRLAFADLFQRFGIPKGCLLDNGRAFASKWITGGAKTRFRFKIREDDPTGLLPALGINPHWAMPYRGSSKPIERGFRDFCDAIAKHPAFAGAYTGNRPDAKPDNYGDRAVPLDDFLAVVAAGIAAHNARPGRRTELGAGVHSFDDVFARSYAAAPIGKATPEQLRLALLAADDVSTDRKSGAISLYGNRYWTADLGQIAGDRVTVRFDPDDLLLPIHVYARDGRFLATAPLIAATGFLDAGAAKARARQERDHRTAARRAEQLQQLLEAGELAALMPSSCDPELPAASVIRPVRHRGHVAAALKPLPSGAPVTVENPLNDRFATAIGRLRAVE